VAEVGYLLGREAGAHVESLFLRALADGDFEPVDLNAADYRRAGELVVRYGDLPLGTTDATVVALAERLGVHEVATLDRRHFTVVRPRGTSGVHQGGARPPTKCRFRWPPAVEMAGFALKTPHAESRSRAET
jgi:hypothetical protein